MALAYFFLTMDHSVVQLITALPEWHAAYRNFYPPLVFKVPRELIDCTTLASKNDTLEALLEIDKINDAHVDPELYSGVYIPGPEWDTRRARMSGSGDNGWLYFIFCPPKTFQHIQFTTVGEREVTFRMRCDVFHVPGGKNPKASDKCLRYVPKRLLGQCRFEIKITPLNPFGKTRHWDSELQISTYLHLGRGRCRG